MTDRDDRTEVDLVVAHASELLTARTPSGRPAGADLDHLEVVRDGAVAVTDGRVTAVGTTEEVLRAHRAREVVDASGRLVTPGFVDSHVHLVHGGSRHTEHERRVRGLDPLSGPRGIAATIAHTAAASDDELRDRALADLDVMIAHGTTTAEAKTGYGGGADGELRLLEISASLDHPVTVVPTFLGAHAIPPERAADRDGFIDEIVAALPEARTHAAFVDVFCDPLGVTPEEAERVLAAAADLDLPRKVHADQHADVGATALAARYRATSADHADYASAEAIAAVADVGTVGVLLPGVAHHLAELTPALDGEVAKPHLPAQVRRLTDAGVTLALSTDYNPGTSPTRSQQTVLELALRLYRLPVAASWLMATLGGAHALGVADHRGSLEPGKVADLVIWQVPEHGMVAGGFGTNLVAQVFKDGVRTVHR